MQHDLSICWMLVNWNRIQYTDQSNNNLVLFKATLIMNTFGEMGTMFVQVPFNPKSNRWLPPACFTANTVTLHTGYFLRWYLNYFSSWTRLYIKSLIYPKVGLQIWLSCVYSIIWTVSTCNPLFLEIVFRFNKQLVSISDFIVFL